ncbi:hypothetical protein [Acidovorax sp. sic0104]|uniref:hypothetical protein n=1 Tax=Acidovorax sp. sic0104 TaxID=2854784 RepID=UPI001C479560|nr:hypothetical protein [Acidovorax sp. sic0104]MBV7541900.1 hypothetical protein [Acidovorax sp. sic0104]
MAGRIASYPWHARSLRSPGQWPLSLKNALVLLLECKLPMYLAWSPGLTQLYNDAYRPILGDKHEGALGGSARTTWSDIWPTIGPMWQAVLRGEAIGFDDFKLTIERYGVPEDRCFNFSYSPVRLGQPNARRPWSMGGCGVKRIESVRRPRSVGAFGVPSALKG